LDQERADEADKPPSLNLSRKQPIVSLEKSVQKEAFLVAQNIFDRLVDKVHVQVVTDISTCQQLFESFSPKDTVFSTWDFRFAWYNAYKYLPAFFVIYYNDKPVGLLPLWYENDKKQFRWFGSWWMEESSFWVFNQKYIPLLLALAPERTYLNAITIDSNLAKILKLEPDDPKYVLDLRNKTSAEEFLIKLKKKQRYNLKRDYRIIESLRPEIEINNYSSLEELFKLSINRFAEKGEHSDFIDDRRKEAFRQIIKQAKSYQVRIIKTKINHQTASLDFAFLYKDCYCAAKCGNNVKAFPGIGNFINLYQINEAIQMGFKKIDFLEISYGWKEKIFQSMPLYYFQKGLTKKELRE